MLEKILEKDKEKEKVLETKKDIDFNNHFKLPIFYNEKKVSLKKHIINDLELVETIDASCNPMYHFLFNTNKDDTFSKKTIEQISEYYTTDTDFLKDSQELIKTYNPLTESNIVPFPNKEKDIRNLD